MNGLCKMLAAGLAILAGSTAASAAEPVVGRAAPDFEMTLVNGSKVTLAELRGQVVVLNF